MRTIILLALTAIMGLFCLNLNAQEEVNEHTIEIEILEKRKEEIIKKEKELLKNEVSEIVNRVEKGELSEAAGEELKQIAAEKHALNIENKLTIIDNQISLLKRGEEVDNLLEIDDVSLLKFVSGKKTAWWNRPKYRYDRRTTSDFVFAVGFNNAIVEGQGLDDSPYRIAGSRFAELGWAWKTRVFKNTAWLRLKYGFSFQFNGLKPTGNRIVVEDGDQTVLEEFPFNLDKSKFRNDNLVFPIHFEIGPYKKKEREDYIRYSTYKKFKIGLGGYAGFNIGSRLKLRFNNEVGNRVREKIRDDFNVNDFVYGLSSYIAWGKIALYGKYDLNTIFENNPVEQRNISLGVRFDID